jgi:hypothetical protein
LALRDLSSFLSRYFIIAYYVPTLFGLSALSLVLRRDWVPNQVELTHSNGELLDKGLGAHLLAIAVMALPVALLLTGLRSHIFRLYRTFPLYGLDVKRVQLGRWTLTFPKWLQSVFLWPERRRWDKLYAESFHPDADVRNAAAAELLASYPADRRTVQPARFGNIIRGYEERTSELWGMDHQVVWPRVESLFTDQEQALHDEVRTTLGFAVMVSLIALIVGGTNAIGVLSSDVDWNGGRLLWNLVPFVIWYAAYRGLVVDALVVSGQRIRASMDLHRLDLYRQLGVRGFETFSDEERDLGRELSSYLSIGPQQVTTALGRSDWDHQEA